MSKSISVKDRRKQKGYLHNIERGKYVDKKVSSTNRLKICSLDKENSLVTIYNISEKYIMV